MPYDARNKLRSMGGIMASSPELMQAAAQRFQAGGLAMPGVPRVQYGNVVRPQLEPLAPVRPAGLPESPVFRGGRGGFPPIGTEEDVIAELMAQSGAFRGGRSGREPVGPTLPPPVDPIEEARILDERIATLQETVQRPGVSSRTAELEAERAQMDSDLKARATERAVASLADVVRPITDMGQDDKARATQRALDALAKRAPVTDGGEEPGADAGAGDQGAADQKPKFKQRQSLRAAFRENLDVIKDLYGIDDEDQARDRMMNLAMMGLAIASGTSPNALTNIAQGLAVGAQGFATSAAQRREREQGIREAALDLTLSERAAEDEFIRGQMEAEQEFIRDVALEKIKNAPDLRAETSSLIETPLGKFEVFKATRQGAEQGLGDMFKNPDAVVSAYKREMAEKNRLLTSMGRADQLLRESPDAIAGVGGAFARAITSLGNAFGIDTPNLTPSQEYDTLMTQLAAELAPVILGESGRTISDTDRARVAEALGFVVDKASIGGDPGVSITGFVQTAVSDPQQLRFALSSITDRLTEAYAPAEDFMRKNFPDQVRPAPAGEAVEVDGSTYTVRETTKNAHI